MDYVPGMNEAFSPPVDGNGTLLELESFLYCNSFITISSVFVVMSVQNRRVWVYEGYYNKLEREEGRPRSGHLEGR